MKCYQRIVALCLSMCMAISLFCVSNVEVYASTDLNMECVGSLNENFDELTDVNALYQKSGEGVLSGTWQFTELSAWGKGSNEIKPLDSGNKGLNMTATEDWAKPGGVDFMFDKPLAPEYILDISYDMHFDGNAVAAALFSNGNFDNHDNAGIGRRMDAGDDSFQIINGNGQGKATVGTWNQCSSGTITVKAVYDLYAWTYSAEVFLNGTSVASMTDGIIGPSSYDPADTCTPGSTYEKLSFVVQKGMAYVDNVSVKAYKAYKIKYNAYAKVDYSNPSENVGMTQVAVANQEVERAGRKGMLMDRDGESEMYMLFDVDYKLLYNIPKATPIEVTVEYFDEGNGYFELAYDGYDALPGRNDIWVNTEYVRLTNSLEWKSYTFYTESMRMTNRADNSDFRLGVFSLKDGRSPESVVVGSVVMRTTEYRDPLRLVSVTGNKPGNIYSKGEEIGINLNFESKSAHEAKGTFSYTVKSDDGRNIGGEEGLTCVFPAWENTTLTLYPPEGDKYGIYYLRIEGIFEDIDGKDTELLPFSADIEYSLAWEVTKEDINDKYGTALLICEHEWSAKDGVAAEIAGRAGIGWNREEVRWSKTELVPGVYKIPDNMRRELEYAKEMGMKIELGLLYSNPNCYDSFADMMDPPTTEEELKAYGNWCEWLARETKGLVYAFAVWNEYTLDSFNSTNDSTENYVKIMETAYEAVKKGNPDALVIGCDGIGATDIPFFEHVFAANGLNYMDVLGLHPYDWSGHFDTQKLVNECNQLKELMRKYGEEKPIWWTEFGFGARYTLEEQRNNLVMMYALQECYDLAETSYQFRFQDDLRIGVEEAKWGLIWSYEDLGRENGAKPSYLGICAMNNLIGANAEAKGAIKDGTTYAFRFYNKKMGKDVAVLAGEYDAQYMTIRLGTNALDVYDVYGNKLAPVASEDGVYGFSINKEPIYVTGNFTAFEQVGELEDIASGIVKEEVFVEQFSALTAGDRIHVKLHQRLLSENEGGCCVLAFYDSAGALVQSVLDTVSFAEENKYWNGCGTTVPQNAANAKVFVWKNNTLAPLMTPILLKN